MDKRSIRLQQILVTMLIIVALAMGSLKGSAATKKIIYGNYIDYTTSKKSDVIQMKLHKATKKKVVWSSSNTKVAVVKSTGTSSATVTVKGKGSCTIKAKVNGKTYTAKITAGKKEGGKKQVITMEKIPDREVMAGESFTLKAILQPSSLSKKYIKWKTSNASIASVSQKGKVTLRKAGKVKITAYYAKDRRLSVSVTFQVVKAKIYISKIVLSGPKVAYVGNTVNFKATVSPKNATNKTLTWSSSNPKVAKVSQKGVVSCLAVGQVTISVKTNDGTKAKVESKTLTIKKPRATQLDVETSHIPQPLQVGDSFTLKASVKPDNASDKRVIWFSDNEDAITIDANGKVTCVGTGKATITVESADPQASKLKKEIPLTVYPRKAYITSLKMTGPDLACPNMDIYYSIISILPGTHEDKISWSSSNSAVAKVVEGDNAGCKIHSIQNGKTVITARTTGGLKTQITLEVMNETFPKNMSIDKIPIWKLYQDSSFTIVTTLFNIKGDKVASPLIWTSSNPEVASVDTNGKVTAHKSGTVTITVKSKENKDLTHSETFTFYPGVAVKKLTISDKNIPEGVIYTGDEFDLVPVIEPENASDKTVSWVSSDDTIATVDAHGHFKALKTGTVIITVYLNANPNFKATIKIPVDGYAAQ